MLEQIEQRFRDVAPDVDFWSLRLVRECDEVIVVRRNILQPVRTSEDVGAMITVIDGRGLGYAGTCDLTTAGLRRAADQACEWARRTAATASADFSRLIPLPHQGTFETPVRIAWKSLPLKERIDIVREECERLRTDPRIVDWEAGLWNSAVDSWYRSSSGARVEQSFRYLLPTLSATANQGTLTQTRTLGGHAYARQGGLEVLQDVGFRTAAPRIAAQALELLTVASCPTGVCDLLLAPDQMILQIHESIGHPLELDRILGDERNYAGTSFVTPDMFGTYRYGSELLDVTFDPTRPEQLASYAFDDDGQPAAREFIIRNGILLRPLGSRSSQLRGQLPGVANARATSWNRPPIDRMANLNVEAGTSTFADMVQAVERGVYMESNCSWSIDDSRNKFQFGCEWGRLIENGELAGVVRKPNYRGVSATFWRSLKMVGDRDTVQVLGTPYCGKGEPNQVIRVGHASPACLFGDVDVFGGE